MPSSGQPRRGAMRAVLLLWTVTSRVHAVSSDSNAASRGLAGKPSPPPSPPLPRLPPQRTCEAKSPAADLPFCDQSKSHEERTALLVKELTLEEQTVLWALHSYHYPIPRLNIKGLHRDTCCVHGAALNLMDGPWVGVEPKFVTVLPHAINHGSMFDLNLAARLANATGNEMRAVSQIRYNTSGGQAYAAVACDSGPLANTAHHPAWGRIAETYGEDPYLVSSMGATVTSVMQARDRGVLRTALTTRHYMGYHKTNTMPTPTMQVTDRDLFDAYIPGYRACAVDGGAEGIMCGFASFNGVPSCANKRLLQTLLRDAWGSDSVVQSDCCDSLTSIKSQHNYTSTFEEAVAAGLGAGLQLCFGCDPNHGAKATEYLAGAIQQGLVAPSELASAVERVMLTRFRLGEFDEGAGRPWAHVDTSLLDSPQHRALAREAAAASVVMARNRLRRDGATPALPFVKRARRAQPVRRADPATNLAGAAASRDSSKDSGNGVGATEPSAVPATPTIAVIGPFANCSDEIGGWSKANCYLHSYAGIPSRVVSVLDAVAEDAVAMGYRVVYLAGTTDTAPVSPTSIADAVAAAGGAALTVLAVGTGGGLEAEGKDRLSLELPPAQADLFEAVSSATLRGGGTLVTVCVSAGPVVIDPNGTDALLYAGYGGEEAGHGVSDVVFGRVSPSARFPLTVYAADYLSKVGPVSDFSSTSGVGRTYRYLNTTASPPLFSFGFGLSLSKFRYSALAVTPVGGAGVVAGTVAGGPGGEGDWPALSVEFIVANVGGVKAHEVAQVYVSVPGAGAREPALPVPLRSLQAFARPLLAPQASSKLSFLLNRSQIATVQSDGTSEVTRGVYTVSVGGRQPTDDNPEGVAQGNVLSATISVE